MTGFSFQYKWLRADSRRALFTGSCALGLKVLGLESEPYAGNWGVVKAFDSFALDRKIHAAGWNFFFMAAAVKVMFFGALGAKKIQNALKRS